MEDVLLDANNDLRIENGDFVIGDSLDQEVAALLQLRQGELKEDPLLGPDLFRLIHTNATEAELKQAVKMHLARDGKDYEDLKERLKLKVNE